MDADYTTGRIFFLSLSGSTLVSRERKDKLEWRGYILINLQHSSFLLAMNANRLIRRESADSEFTIRSEIFWLFFSGQLLFIKLSSYETSYYLFPDNTFEFRNQCTLNWIQVSELQKINVSLHSLIKLKRKILSLLISNFIKFIHITIQN